MAVHRATDTSTEINYPFRWLHRFSVLTAAVAVLLIVAGAAVTSTGSGDAVPDWPLSYGTLTPPMIGGILFEHSHRLIAGFTGILVALMAVWLWVAAAGRRIRWLGILALCAVLIQALLGGLRVLVISTPAVQDGFSSVFGPLNFSTVRIVIAVIHGFFAQSIVCLLFAIALFTSRKWNGLRQEVSGGGLRPAFGRALRLSVALVVMVFLQLLLGTLVRHTGAGLIIPDFPLSFGHLFPPFGNLPHDPAAPFPLSEGAFAFRVAVQFAHRLMALLILTLVSYLFFAFRRKQHIGGLVTWLLGLTVVQFCLGALNIWTAKSVFSSVPHVAIGALILGTSILTALWSRRLNGSELRWSLTRKKASSFVELTKPRLTSLIIFSTLTGFYLGSSGTLNFAVLVNTLMGVGLASAGALALNQFLERELDARMKRTRHRPLPDGRLKPAEALVFGTVLCILGVLYLALTVNTLTALLVVITILSYLFAYTPLKRVSVLNTAVGAVPGALPIVCGWTAARNALGWESLILFGILFFWQFPHFLSIAILYGDDYRQAGYRMMPIVENGLRLTNAHIVLTSVALLVISLLPTFLGLTGLFYLIMALIAGLSFLLFGIRLALYHSRLLARKLLFASFVYPLLVWGAMMLDKIQI